MSDSEKEDGGHSSPIQSRHEKSLGLLTTKFVDMLKSAEGGILDLKKVLVCSVRSMQPIAATEELLAVGREVTSNSLRSLCERLSLEGS